MTSTSAADIAFERFCSACGGDDVDQVRQMLLSINSINQVSLASGTSPLMIACHANNLAMVQLLLDCGALVTFRNASGFTALHWACLSTVDDCSILQLLVEHGADVNVTTRSGITAVDYACKSEAKLRWLWQHGASDESVLLAAARRGFTDIVEAVVLAGVDIDVRDSSGRTALLRAVSAQCADVARFLLTCGCNHSLLTSNDGRHPIYHLLYNDDRQTLVCLLAAGANVHVRDFGVRLPLITSLKYTSHSGLDLLLAAGADPNAIDSTGQTAMQCAQQNSAAQCLLIAAGATGELPQVVADELIAARTRLADAKREIETERAHSPSSAANCFS